MASARLSLRIAARFLKSSKLQTILIVLGIAIGVSVQVFVGSLIGSLQKNLVDQVIGDSSHVTITPADKTKTIADWEDIVARIKSVDSVSSASPVAESPAFLLRGNSSYPVQVRGFIFSMAEGIYEFSEKTYQGRVPSKTGEVIIGKELNDDIKIRVSDKLTFMTPSGNVSEFTVVGFFDFKVAQVNRLWAVTTLQTAQETFKLGTNITSVEMQVRDVFDADAAADEIKTSLADDSLAVSNWKTQNKQLLSGLQSQSISSYMIQVFVLASVVIAIGSILAIKVVQKSREIGILKAMGMQDRSAGLIFLYQGLILGTAGALTGLVIGIGLLTGFTSFARGSDGGPILKITLDYSFLVASLLIAILSSAFAAVLPARKTSRLSPIEVIRNG